MKKGKKGFFSRQLFSRPINYRAKS